MNLNPLLRDLYPHLWLFRIVASQWLREHPDDPNAAQVREAIEKTDLRNFEVKA